MQSEGDTLPGPRKAAILLASLGAEVSARIFQNLDEPEIEVLSAEISQLSHVDDRLTTAVLREFVQMAQTHQHLVAAGPAYAISVLEKAMGRERALEVVGRIQAAVPPVRFAGVRNADPHQLASVLRREHPQTAALVLVNLDPDFGAAVLTRLPEDLRAEVVLRVATMDKTSPEVVRQVEQVLEKQVSAGFASRVSYGGGAKTVADMLNRVDPPVQKELLGQLDEAVPALAEQVRALMFTFEDLLHVDDRGLQRLLQEVEQKDLVLALKAAGEELAAKIFRNMSERTGAIVRQELELLGPVRLRDVEQAQRRVVAVARRLEEAGEIVLARGGGDELV